MRVDKPGAIPPAPPQVYGLAAVLPFGISVVGLYLIRHAGIGFALTVVAAACSIPMLYGSVIHLVDPKSRRRYAAWNAAVAARKAVQEAEARAVAERRAAVTRELSEVMARNREADKARDDGGLAKAVADITAADRARDDGGLAKAVADITAADRARGGRGGETASSSSPPGDAPTPRKKRKTGPKTIRSKVVGVTYLNADGSDRQQLIARYCRPGMQLGLRPEPDNPRDPFAVAVTAVGYQIGYIRSELAEEILGFRAAGMSATARILEVTGGGRRENFGVNIAISLA